MFLSRLKGIDRGYKLSVLLSRRDAIVNLATVEFSFGAVVLTEKWVFDKTYEKIGVTGSYFSTYGYANSFVCSSCHWMSYNWVIVLVWLDRVVFQS